MPRANVLLLLTLCGCASGGLASTAGPSTTQMDTGIGTLSLTSMASERIASQAVSAPAERVWAALPGVYQALGLSGGVVSEPARIYGTPLLRFRGRLAGERASSFLSCGSTPIGAPAANAYDLEATVRASVQPNPDGTSRLDVLVEATAAPPAGGTKTLCSTTGVLEDRITAQVRKAVAS